MNHFPGTCGRPEVSPTRRYFAICQQAPDDIRWTIEQTEFGNLLALKKDSAPGPDRIPYGAYRCAGGLGSKFLFNAYRACVEGVAIPDCFAESRTVFIPRPLTSMTVEGSSDHLMHFLLPSVEAFTGTQCDAFIPQKDASPSK